MGVEVDILSENFEGGETVSDIFIKNKRLRSISIEKSKVPSLIDEIPILAVIATQAEGKTIIRGAEELRVKESDRIESILLICAIWEQLLKNLMMVFHRGPSKLNGTTIRTFGDHRIAMAFTIAGLVANGETKLDNISA